MILTLEVSPPQAAQLGAASDKTFRASGGLIGRDKSNDWILPHTKVSSRHARISYHDATFYIEDTSTNGVFLNSSRQRLPKGRPQALVSGDRILIDPYEIRVTITNDAEDAVERRAHLAPSHPVQLLPDLEAIAQAMPDEELDPLKLLDLGPRRKPVLKAPNARDLERSSPMAAHYQPPAVHRDPAPPRRPSPPGMIPEGYNPLLDDSVDAPSAGEDILADPSEADPPAIIEEASNDVDQDPAFPPVMSTEATSVTGYSPPSAVVRERPDPGEIQPISTPSSGPTRGVDLAEVLAGAGLTGVPVTAELAQSFGEILRVVVSGVMDILQARQEIKDEFRMRMTRFKAADNNPLKLSANVDDALHNLLVKHNDAYLEPVEAFEDAFRDLKNHQLALLAGMRVAFESLLAQFEPDRLQEQFDRQIKRGQLFGMPAKLRYWDLYRDAYQETAKDPESRFRKLFGEEFARAYEEQLELLKRKAAG